MDKKDDTFIDHRSFVSTVIILLIFKDYKGFEFHKKKKRIISLIHIVISMDTQ